MKKVLKNQSGIGKITLIILILIVVLAIFLIAKSDLFSSKEEVKVENEVAGQLEAEYDSID